MNDTKKNQVAVKVYFKNEDPMLPDETIWLEADHWASLYTLLDQELVNRNVQFARTDIYTRWDTQFKQEEDWTFKESKRYMHPLAYPDYMFLNSCDTVWRNSYDTANRLCIHIPTSTRFHIFRRTAVNFSESMMEDKQNIFYKFSYTGEDGTVTPMIIYTRTEEEKSDEEIRHIKYEILKNGAKWFCKHLDHGNEGHWFGNEFKYESI